MTTIPLNFRGKFYEVPAEKIIITSPARQHRSEGFTLSFRYDTDYGESYDGADFPGAIVQLYRASKKVKEIYVESDIRSLYSGFVSSMMLLSSLHERELTDYKQNDDEAARTAANYLACLNVGKDYLTAFVLNELVTEYGAPNSSAGMEQWMVKHMDKFLLAIQESEQCFPRQTTPNVIYDAAEQSYIVQLEPHAGPTILKHLDDAVTAYTSPDKSRIVNLTVHQNGGTSSN